MMQEIRDHLSTISASYGVDILYAVESGSRAWGFESPDSDFDVRFIYREPPGRAFRLYPGRDVIEVEAPVTLGEKILPGDFVGWSLQKAMRLACASNPQMMEWSEAPIVYACADGFAADLAELRRHSNPRALAHHYRGLAKTTWHHYLAKDEDPVGKKYLYAIRPLLASAWICDHPRPGDVPPVLFEQLRREIRPHPHTASSDRIDAEIDALLAWKMRQDEARGRRRFPLIDDWIQSELARLERAVPQVPEYFMDPEIVERVHARAYPDVFPEPGNAASLDAHHRI